MSKLIFSTLSILALLLLGTNCSTGKRGGERRDIQICKVDLELNPGDECSGPNYSLHNNAGELVWDGSYFDSRGTSYRQGKFIDNGVIVDEGRFACDSLVLTRDDNAWTIKSLPPPVATVR